MKDNQAKYPQLRFKGFTDHWEKRTLGQTTTKAKSYSLSRDVERDHETGYRYIHYGDIHTGVADIVTEHTKLPNIEPANYDELRVNDLVVADASEDYQGIAEPAVVVGLPTHLVAGLHTITLRPSSASSLYLYYLLHTDSFKHFGYQMGTGLKVFGISWSNLSKFTFMIPSRPEQEMIVKLIESVDNLIAVNQRKLAKLKELKQGYLQKMFPQNGSKFPQLRFAGFADAWEQRKLGEEAQLTMGQSPNSENYTKNPDDYILVQGNADMKNGRVVPRVWTTQITKKAEKSDLILSVRAPVGDIGKTDYDVVLGRGVAAIKGNEFIFQQLGKMKLTGYWTRYSTGSTFESINSNDIKDAKIMVPVEEEQQKIGAFFKQLDDTIVLHQRKLEKLQELKKGYLQKMFC
ncbi:restriction endonuclease subunit S [Lactobacillus fermentum 3872] [Lactiplantibacillus plantarum]|uniref:Type I restriction-modification system,specificity subunit S n=1 Tax=Lactiplantibacillus plantarum CMPG5300 TaxID=1304889 RepID=A0AAW3FIL9_LACPN|nr:restriction endonuclease subunit S [Lactiplantibacillus plantarum]KGH41136.1 Type I restriction-modification system,specificity subunit S [Lactiplantibacillus plantarum CMPG5300]KZU51045.1 Type I restriction-modification system specificity subunit S [Lactiplantibacillus plantarum]KZV00158.1 Type I restriction-modification system specificity subunit S [Lactiplantibacillus plantarum]MCT3261151.1 restriction endonuclease subunit S [Lactiplantibacillus plantarum]MCW6149266.1 restriction endonuc